MSRNILLRIAYDGTEFNGYQIQAKGERTVQGVLEAALSEMHGHEVQVSAAGRTDSGVHADAQYVNFYSDLDTIPGEKFVLAVNRYLPPDLKGQESREVPREFHARFSAKSRAYRYFVLVAPMPVPKYRNYAYRISDTPNLEGLNRDASALLGEHDFTTFAAVGQGTESNVREVRDARFTWEPPFVVFSIRANGFLWKQVRSIVGTLLDRDRDRRGGATGASGGGALPSVGELLRARDRNLAGTTAPPQGLFLTDVTYDV